MSGVRPRRLPFFFTALPPGVSPLLAGPSILAPGAKSNVHVSLALTSRRIFCVIPQKFIRVHYWRPRTKIHSSSQHHIANIIFTYQSSPAEFLEFRQRYEYWDWMEVIECSPRLHLEIASNNRLAFPTVSLQSADKNMIWTVNCDAIVPSASLQLKYEISFNLTIHEGPSQGRIRNSLVNNDQSYFKRHAKSFRILVQRLYTQIFVQ